MSERPEPHTLWVDYLSDAERERLARGGFGRRTGFGARTAVIVIDAQNYMVGPVGDEDLDYVSSCGPAGREAVDKIGALLGSAREHGVPIFYTRFELARDGRDMGAYGLKRDLVHSEGWALEGSFGARIAEACAPGPEDFDFVKKKPSGFHGTPLLGYLINLGIDTVVVVGGSTSNCIRATVVDAMSYNYRAIVPADCVFDRIDVSHRIALFDLDRQYADVVWSEDVIEHFEGAARTAAGPAGAQP